MSKGRIELFDALRGLALYSMLIYHFAYDLAMFSFISWDDMFSLPMEIFERYICCSFIILAGISSCFSRNNLKRGALVFVCGLIVSLGSAIAGVTIRFGVLELLGSSMMLYAVFGKYINKLGAALPIVCVPVFAAGYYVYRNVYVTIPWLYPFGLRTETFVSADYFPLWPWFFLFLIGTYIGRKVRSGERKPWMEKKYSKVLTVPGKHTLLIYMAHQPILYGITMLMAKVF